MKPMQVHAGMPFFKMNRGVEFIDRRGVPHHKVYRNKSIYPYSIRLKIVL